MMHGYLKTFLPDAMIKSAGIETHGINPNAVIYMKEEDIDISNHSSNHIDEYIDISFDHIISVCDHAKESCPVFPAKVKQHHYNFTDPSKVEGTEKEIATAFRITRDQIKAFSKGFSFGLDS